MRNDEMMMLHVKDAMRKARAHWLSRDTILWPIPDEPKCIYVLHANPQGGLIPVASCTDESGAYNDGAVSIVNDDGIPSELITLFPTEHDPELQARFPHLDGVWLRLPRKAAAKARRLLKGAVALSRWRNAGMEALTSLQIPGVLDDLFKYNGPLGVTYDGDVPTLRVWAPTAQRVQVQLYADSRPETAATHHDMDEDPVCGVWSLTGSADWTGMYYLFAVTVYTPGTGKIETHQVTDPYSLSLATNGTRSQIVNLNHANLKPEGWDAMRNPPVEAPEDAIIYELHIRDFSSHDDSVPEGYRGTYKAFTQTGSAGMQHLRALAEAGLTHIHLLPAFDFASVNDDKSTWQSPSFHALSAFPPDSASQQAMLAPYRDRDGFNWGYDPVHYAAPEGSYSTNPDGATRVVEFREMVQALNQIGLRVIMDVVYNHTHASGQAPYSVLDQIVPGYYYRLNAEGGVEHSTCCENTASEHAMMEKLMVDSMVMWARDYKVDGFRFDLMGHHMVRNLVAVRAALDTLTLEQDGVDGTGVWLYGEGWNFGEVADNRRGINATQANIAGTGIGTFNDRIRDAVRGGSAFGSLREQGFITGLYDAPNADEQRSPEERRLKLMELTDWLRVSLVGSLQDFRFRDTHGRDVSGREVSYNGLPTGYTQDPQEAVNYISAHDNETLFDAIQIKAAEMTTLAERIRMHNLGISLVMLAQGVPFFHAGVDMLRSKSLDRNSYNSGDWFNRLDFSYQSNGWGGGLPPASENQVNWPVLAPLLGNPALKPSPDDIQNAVQHFREMLRIRRSSRLFRLRTAREVVRRVSFPEVVPEPAGANPAAPIPGLIVMQIDNRGLERGAEIEQILVVFSAAQTAQAFTVEALKGVAFKLHPVQAESHDPVVRAARYNRKSGVFSVPACTAAVFVAGRRRRPSTNAARIHE
ncbi:MAG: pullulanase-type alpha-1,6-glucosidase [Anaerolineae bacterium]|nr:pullulanase-type alpha-1,6-glucosidase [Anaerolineae bacterium]